MIVYNNRELKSPYSVGESKVIEINSTLEIDELIESIRLGSFDASKTTISSYSFDSTNLDFMGNDDVNETPLLNSVFTNAQIEVLVQPHYERPEVFKDFEDYTFGKKVDLEFKQEDITFNELFKELKAAIGIIPSLIDENLPISELRSLSNAGKQLMLPNTDISSQNPCPSIDEIKEYNDFGIYEKRLISKLNAHPYTAFNFALKLKDVISKGYKLNAEDYHTLLTHMSEGIDSAVEKIVADRSVPEELITKATDLFNEKYHFVPRVLNEYLRGCIARFPNLNDTSLAELVNTFSRQSVGQIAATKSPTLLALSNNINFAEFSNQLTEALATYLTTENVSVLEEKKFFDWLKTHKDSSINDIIELIEKIDMLNVFTNISSKDMLNVANNNKGYVDSLKYQEHYKQFNYEFKNNELAIKGRNISCHSGDITMRMLPPDDYKNFTVGYDTTCCQHYGGAGETCTFLATSDPFAGIIVIEEKGEVKAQGFVWTDETTSTLVFDNIEFAGHDAYDDYLSKKYAPIITAYCQNTPYKNVHVGTGYNESMRGWGHIVKYNATMPSTLVSSYIYSDYHDNARSLKTDGEVQLYYPTDSVDVVVEPDEPTRWDELATPALAFMLNDCSRTPEERLAFAKEYIENPTPEKQLELVRANAANIKNIEHPFDEVQNYIVVNHPSYIKYINNPNDEVKGFQLAENPGAILDYENPSQTLVLSALQAQGGLLKELLPLVTDYKQEAYHTAVMSNPKAINWIPTEDINEEIALLALQEDAKLLPLIPEHAMTDRVIGYAISQDATVITKIKNPSFEVMKQAVESNPISILSMHLNENNYENEEAFNHDLHELWALAISYNGFLIRHCGKSFPDLRMTAIQQQPFAIRCFPDPTPEEIDCAVTANPNAYKGIYEPEARAYAYSKAVEIHGVENVHSRRIYNANDYIANELNDIEINV